MLTSTSNIKSLTFILPFMASLHASTSLLLSSSRYSSNRITAAIHFTKPQHLHFSVPKHSTKNVVQELNRTNGFKIPIPISIIEQPNSASPDATAQLYAILEAVADRVEMHTNIGEQRNNWNNLLLNSINMITLTATTMAGVAATGSVAVGFPLLALKLSSALLFSAATGMLVLINKIQPSQLAEEQRNASRLFKQLYTHIETVLAVQNPNENDVKELMEKVLALDKAYPLPLLGTMIEKFPAIFQPAVWWPETEHKSPKEKQSNQKSDKNGWSEELEAEMREIMLVLKRKDSEDYDRLGNLVLNVNKILAIAGPVLTGVAAVGASLNGPWAAVVAAAAGALATSVNTLEHGGQIGMVIEMYRNCRGVFQHLEESIKSTMEERDMQKRENGELFEMKVALELGRSLSQLRDLAGKSGSSQSAMDEFASKLF